MEEGFELLEQKVRKAADLVKRLRKANHDLEEERERLASRLKEAERRLDALEKGRGSSEEARRRESVDEEVAALRREREEIRRRIGKLVEVLDGLE
jgi:FtsZ-binding cell division protein ZapB